GVHQIALRRYRCLGCRAILVVGPWDLLPDLLYSLVTVVVALAQWALGATKASVRAQLGAFSVVGVWTLTGWPSLRRWADRAAQGRLLAGVAVSISGSRRGPAAGWVHIRAGAGAPASSLAVRALAGANQDR